MAPQIELDPYVVETLLPDLVGHDRHPSAFLLYLVLWRHSQGGRRATPPLGLRALAEETGLSKRAVQTAAGALVRRRLVSVRREGATEVPTYAVHRPWAGRGR
jgi:hypothetical protein